jgi:hypothetical protein
MKSVSIHGTTTSSAAHFSPMTDANHLPAAAIRKTIPNYQYRIHVRLISDSSCNEDALTSQLLPIPGVQRVAFQTLAGAFYVYVYAITPLASVSLLQTVQDALAGYVAFPITGTALNPDLVGFSLSTTITLSPKATSTDAQTAVSNAVAAVQNYINNLSVGQELVIDDIGEAILTASPLIVDVGQFAP